MGWTNNPKTNVQRVESWSSKQTLYNKLNRIYRRLCCLTPALLVEQGFVNIKIPKLDIDTLNTSPVELVPNPGGGRIIMPQKAIVTCTVPTAGYAPNPAFDDLAFQLGGASVDTPYYAWRNFISASITRTISSTSQSSPFLGNAKQVADDCNLEALIVGGDPTPGGATDLTLDIYLWYEILEWPV